MPIKGGVTFQIANRTCCFPSVIIVINSMKSLEVNINLGLNSVMVKNVQIPFITGIQSESQMNRKNGQGLTKRTGVQEPKRT